ncbi:hypothetical protein IAQ61_008655 [Plenodomus lingam]|uniref:uncharacterized protein n=1 Tax=Leptosphaeria maculans TaxID=5022 RepID=UPI0033249CDD|nr:hypothetical protein IAQ61_008655 [Plenodomus lingam]
MDSLQMCLARNRGRCSREMPTPSCGPETASDARQRALLSYGTTKAGNIEIYTMFRDHPCQTSRVPGISLVQNSMTMWAILYVSIVQPYHWPCVKLGLQRNGPLVDKDCGKINGDYQV